MPQVPGYFKMSRVMRKPTFCICENKDADQLRGNREADQRLCFRYIVQSLYFLNPKFQASSHLLWLYSLVCVGPGRKPRRLVFSQRGSNTGYFKIHFIHQGSEQQRHPTAYVQFIYTCNVGFMRKQIFKDSYSIVLCRISL